MSVAAIILAAGESRRMGSPKALLELAGETFLDRLIGRLGAVCEPVIVVLGCHAAEIRAAARRASQARFVVNEQYALGQLSSLQHGLRAVPPECEGVVFTLVDHPSVEPETLARLVERPGVTLAIPRYRGRRGHPVYVSAALIPEFLALPEDAKASDVIHRHAGLIRYLDVEDAGVISDVDDAESYRRLVRGAGP